MKVMHYAIDAGHNSPPGDTGAVGLAVEDKLTIELAAKVSVLLIAAGCQVTNCRFPHSLNVGESLRGRVDIANRSGADYYVSLHFNKFLPADQTTDRPMGAEIYVASSAGRTIAQKVMQEITKLGFNIHDSKGASGVKDSGLYVLVHTAMPAILIEPFFLDSTADFAVFKAAGMDLLARSIVKGLLA